jgi:hypothetical protein
MPVQTFFIEYISNDPVHINIALHARDFVAYDLRSDQIFNFNFQLQKLIDLCIDL